jgi:hypothetical protein
VNLYVLAMGGSLRVRVWSGAVLTTKAKTVNRLFAYRCPGSSVGPSPVT